MEPARNTVVVIPYAKMSANSVMVPSIVLAGLSGAAEGRFKSGSGRSDPRWQGYGDWAGRRVRGSRLAAERQFGALADRGRDIQRANDQLLHPLTRERVKFHIGFVYVGDEFRIPDHGLERRP